MKDYKVTFEENGVTKTEQAHAESSSGARNQIKAKHPRAIRVRVEK